MLDAGVGMADGGSTARDMWEEHCPPGLAPEELELGPFPGTEPDKPSASLGEDPVNFGSVMNRRGVLKVRTNPPGDSVTDNLWSDLVNGLGEIANRIWSARSGDFCCELHLIQNLGDEFETSLNAGYPDLSMVDTDSGHNSTVAVRELNNNGEVPLHTPTLWRSLHLAIHDYRHASEDAVVVDHKLPHTTLGPAQGETVVNVLEESSVPVITRRRVLISNRCASDDPHLERLSPSRWRANSISLPNNVLLRERLRGRVRVTQGNIGDAFTAKIGPQSSIMSNFFPNPVATMLWWVGLVLDLST